MQKMAKTNLLKKQKKNSVFSCQTPLLRRVRDFFPARIVAQRFGVMLDRWRNVGRDTDIIRFVVSRGALTDGGMIKRECRFWLQSNAQVELSVP